jgi:hypothetical protein
MCWPGRSSVDRVEVPAERRLVEHVVVNQGGRVNHLHGGRQRQMLRLQRSDCPGRQQQQGRTQSLATQAEAVPGQPIDERIVAAKLLAEELLDLLEFLADRRIQ